jgi:hypothetical protein
MPPCLNKILPSLTISKSGPITLEIHNKTTRI